MEEVLDVYHRLDSSQHPLIWMDESSKPQVSETRQPLPAEPGQPERYASEDDRKGVSTLFLWFAPLDGWRHVRVTARRTTVDWAHCINDV